MINVVIPVFNNSKLTDDCLTGINSTVGPHTVRVVIVDNASTDDTVEVIERWREFAARNFALYVIKNDGNLGFGRACNQGLQVASEDDIGGMICWLNNDTVPLQGWLDGIELELVDPSVGIVGALLWYPSSVNPRKPGPVQHAGIGWITSTDCVHLYRGMSSSHAPGILIRKEVTCVTGACMSMRVRVAVELRGFDEDFVNGYEDIDLCFRARESGKKIVYSPRVQLIHHESMTPGRFSSESQNRELFLQKHQNIRPDMHEIIAADGGIGVRTSTARATTI